MALWFVVLWPYIAFSRGHRSKFIWSCFNKICQNIFSKGPTFRNFINSRLLNYIPSAIRICCPLFWGIFWVRSKPHQIVQGFPMLWASFREYTWVYMNFKIFIPNCLIGWNRPLCSSHFWLHSYVFLFGSSLLNLLCYKTKSNVADWWKKG